ncbi:hypothetical protein GQ54DRAFT_295579 [Martensiomyces pterosporus]|nr:hypothetical protein GQ54DRAFT_295579 [Martensiomyces pterosporus]
MTLTLRIKNYRKFSPRLSKSQAFICPICGIEWSTEGNLRYHISYCELGDHNKKD